MSFCKRDLQRLREKIISTLSRHESKLPQLIKTRVCLHSPFSRRLIYRDSERDRRSRMTTDASVALRAFIRTTAIMENFQNAVIETVGTYYDHNIHDFFR